MDSFLQDLRHTARQLIRRPGFVVTAVASLALGLGVNTAIFSAMNTLLFKPAPLRDLDRAVYVFQSTPERGDSGTSFPAFEAYRDSSTIFESVMAFAGARPLLLSDGDRRESIYAELVTSGFFSMAEIRLQMGQPFDKDVDAIVNPPQIVVLSDRGWRRRFASQPDIVGKTVVLNGRAFTVAGVVAPGFTGLDSEVSVDLWMPASAWAYLVGEPARLTGEEHWLTTIGRLREGVTLAQAQAAMTALNEQTSVRSIRDRSSASEGEALAIGGAAFGAGLLVLMLACANVANLFIARAAARRREMTVRLALGAGRGRVLQLWLIETTMVSVAGGVAGLLVASWALDALVAFRLPAWIGHADDPALPLEFHLDARVAGFALALSIVTSLLVAFIAGVHTARSTSLRARLDRRFAPGFNLRSAVLALQMALALLLLIPCGLLVRSWQHAASADPGFLSTNVLLLPISSDQAGVRVQKPEGFDADLVARVARLPGVESATAMDPVPLWYGENASFFSIDADATRVRMGYSRIGPQYFATLKIPLLRGREFAATDTRTSPGVVIVNETMARQYWPDGAALGHHVREGSDAYEVIGVVRDSRQTSLAERPRPRVYRPLTQEPTDNPGLSLAVRFSGDPSPVRERVQREVQTLVPTWPAFHFRALDEGLALQRLVPRLGATLLGVLGTIGLLLAAIGMYGVTSYVVRQRTREIGIRLALGSPVPRVIAMVIRQGMGVCVTGAAIGIALALVVSRFLDSVLVETAPADLLTYAVVTGVLIGVAVLACYLPSRAVASTHPLEALRDE